MASVWKTAWVGAVAGLAVPVAGLSGLATAGFALILVLGMFGIGPERLAKTSAWGLLTGEPMLYLLISLAIFTISIRFLARLQARCQALVAKINDQDGLSLDAGYLLGYPSPGFLVSTGSIASSRFARSSMKSGGSMTFPGCLAGR